MTAENPPAFTPTTGTFNDRYGIERVFRADRKEGLLLFGSYVLDGEVINDACVPAADFKPDDTRTPAPATGDE